ncbi:MAG: deoxyribose-phosphate aldolase [Clostridiaceae bacterium]|nr:deoxyribose-phosphate aldolase [Clostridiaceae bacterium]
MNIKAIASALDHTLLRVDSTLDQIKNACDEAIRCKTASVCIPPAYAAEAVKYVQCKIPVCTVAGFPNGYSTTAAKVAETEEAIANGVSEVDMVTNIGFLKSGRYDAVEEEIRAIKKVCGDKILKVIIETCLLTEEEKIKMCRIVTEAGADYIKTSTGFSTGNATVEDIVLFAKHIGPNVKIKAAGGIRTLEEAQRFLDAGASRIGSSSLIKLLQDA